MRGASQPVARTATSSGSSCPGGFAASVAVLERCLVRDAIAHGSASRAPSRSRSPMGSRDPQGRAGGRSRARSSSARGRSARDACSRLAATASPSDRHRAAPGAPRPRAAPRCARRLRLRRQRFKPVVDLVVAAAGTESTRRIALVTPARGPARHPAVFYRHAQRRDPRSRGGPRVSAGTPQPSAAVFRLRGTPTSECARLLAEGRAGIGALTDVLPLDRGPAAFAELAGGPTDDIKVFPGCLSPSPARSPSSPAAGADRRRDSGSSQLRRAPG